MSFLPGMFPAGAAAAGEKEFPVVEAVGGGTIDTYTPSHSASLPAGVVAGDLLIAISSFVGAATPTPSGWTLIVDNSGQQLAAWYRIATGTDSFAYTLAFNSISATVTMRISGYSSAPEGATVATGFSTTPNPPSLTPSWGSAKTLWIAACGAHRLLNNHSITGIPSTFTTAGSFVAVVGSVTESRSCGAAYLQSEADTVDPGTFTISNSLDWRAMTLAVRPA